MSEVHRVGDLDLNEDDAFQRRWWIVERIGWVLIALVLVAGMLGLFGEGILSATTTKDSSGNLQLEYDRFLHKHTPASLKFNLKPQFDQNKKMRFWINNEYLQGVQINSITPQPESVEVEADRTIYIFNVNQASQAVPIIFFVEPENIGSLPGKAGMGETNLNFDQWVYP